MAYLDYGALREWTEYTHEPTKVSARLSDDSNSYEIEENGMKYSITTELFHKMFSLKKGSQSLIPTEVLNALNVVADNFHHHMYDGPLH